MKEDILFNILRLKGEIKSFLDERSEFIVQCNVTFIWQNPDTLEYSAHQFLLLRAVDEKR
ncbi:MAG: hypothetical protein ACYCPR_08970 [Thermoplasmataceae archaeon]